ncbi:hypothetical protein Tco_0218582 [Tanacetum coccineum]
MVGGGLVGRGLSGRVLCGEAIQGAGCAGVGRFAVGFWLNREGRCADWVKVVGEVAGRGGVRGWGCSGPVGCGGWWVVAEGGWGMRLGGGPIWGVTDWYQSQVIENQAKRLRGIHYSSSSQMYPYAVMSSISSAVTYTSVYTDSEPGRVFWGADEEISDGGSPRFIVYGYDGLPMHPAHDPDYVLEPMYPEYIQLEDEHVFPAEEQPLPPVDSPTTESPGYVTESDPEEDPEEYEDDETEDGPVDYPMDGGDDGDDDEGDSSRDDAYDEDEDKEDDEEEEEHPAPADSAVVVPTVEPVSPPEGTEPGETLLGYCRHYHHLHYHHYHHLYTYHPPVDRRDDVPESELPPRKRLCLSTLGPSTVDAEARRQGIDEVGYGIRDTWVDPAEAVPEIAPMTVGEVNTRVTELTELHERDTQDLYALLEDAQDGRTRISQRVAMDSQRIDLLMGDRMTLQETVWIVEEEAYASREA